MSRVTKTSASHGKKSGVAHAFSGTNSRLKHAHCHTLSSHTCTHTHFFSPSHTHTQWPCGLCRALWMKKRSHLSDSSLLHLAAPFKNTLYSLLTLKLHLTDSMMESPILPPFLPPLFLILSLSLLLFAVSGASPVFPPSLPTVLAEKWRLSFSDNVRKCRPVRICASDCVRTCVCVCVLGCFGMDPCVSVFACLIGGKKVWQWNVYEGENRSSRGCWEAWPVRAHQELTTSSSRMLSRISLLFAQPAEMLYYQYNANYICQLYCCPSFTSKSSSRLCWSIKFILDFIFHAD